MAGFKDGNALCALSTHKCTCAICILFGGCEGLCKETKEMLQNSSSQTCPNLELVQGFPFERTHVQAAWRGLESFTLPGDANVADEYSL